MPTEREKIALAERDRVMQPAMQVTRLAIQRGVRLSAAEDSVRRAFQALGDKPFDTYSGQAWADGEQVNAPHLFESKDTAPTPQSQGIDYNAIKDPGARLTAFREAQAQQGQRP